LKFAFDVFSNTDINTTNKLALIDIHYLFNVDIYTKANRLDVLIKFRFQTIYIVVMVARIEPTYGPARGPIVVTFSAADPHVWCGLNQCIKFTLKISIYKHKKF
jgi:hypothetical protein